MLAQGLRIHVPLKKKKCYTVNRLLRSNEPQANDRTQRMDRKDCQTNPHFEKTRNARSACPEEGLKNGAGSTKHATLTKAAEGNEGGEARSAQAGSNATRPHTSQWHFEACCSHAHMQAGCIHRHANRQAGHAQAEHASTSCNGCTCTCCQ
jgi:hypothetical protein